MSSTNTIDARDELILDGQAVPGAWVTVSFNGDPDDTDVFQLGSREMLGLNPDITVQIFSPQSPLGAVVLGKSEGDETSYVAPTGKTIQVSVVKIETFSA